jgi:malate dehydrogenase
MLCCIYPLVMLGNATANKMMQRNVQAYAAFTFAEACMKAMHGQVSEQYAYVASELTSLPFFASKVRLGPSGVTAVLPLPVMTGSEKSALAAAIPELQGSIEKGIKFATS